MSWLISPGRFVQVFDEVVSQPDRAAHIRGFWHDVPKYTQLFLGRPEGVLHKVAESLGLADFGGEFLRLDAAYTAEPRSHRFVVAVEHENSIGGAGWEIIKLAYSAIPLRVLVTYPHHPEDDDGRLNDYCRLIEVAGVIPSGQLLVIFGSQAQPAINGQVTSVAWRYYLYAGPEFVLLKKSATPAESSSGVSS